MIFKKLLVYTNTNLINRTSINVFAFFFIFSSVQFSFAQERCGTVEYTQQLKNKQLLLENESTFENWLQKKISKSKKTSALRVKSTYQVPIVVHVIHNGEAIGTGTNISDAQILSQLSVLNKDYKRLNADASNTPAEFLPVASSFDVEFVLAKRTPEGLPTTGIVRVKGTKTSWTVNDNYELKSLSYWPAEDYLNLWVCNIIDYLGYSQFPVSPLAGLENSSNNRLTDGVVIAYKCIGSSDDGAFNLEPNYNKGRTATHEIGHFFGLRHIWGDDNGTCDGTDYVDDTPNQANSTSGCPTHPSVSCSNDKMFQNYLDYTDDVCMNIFTVGQVSRMTTVIENSPRRVSLLTSPALLDPIPVANDLGIKQIITPSSVECNATFTPTIEVRNYGNNNINAAQIELRKDGTLVETLSPSLSLTPLTSMTLNFSNVTLTSGTHTLTFTILQTNGVADGNPADNTLNQATRIAATQTTPFTEVFNTLPASWTVQNPDQKITWQNSLAPNANASNKAMKINFYNYEDAEGEIDLLVSPVMNLSTVPVALLTFDVAYARFNSSNDGLRVLVMTNCNTDLSQATEIYNKTGSALATTNSTTSEFTPSNASQWRTETLDLSSFMGQPYVQLAFVTLNDYGNNLFLDNVGVITSAFEDIAFTEVVSPSPVVCTSSTAPVVRVRNNGSIVITSFTVNYQVNNGTLASTLVKDISLGATESIDVTLPTIALSAIENTLSIELKSPNGVSDLNTSNNSGAITIVVNSANQPIPLKENFDGNFSALWTIANPTNGMNFKPITTNYNTSLYFNAFNNAVADDEAWVVSPTFDFSTVAVTRMYFDLSYRVNPGFDDRLRIVASSDCGDTYSTVLFDRNGTTLSSNLTSTSSWKPNNESDWQHLSVDLSALAGKKDVRIAFVASNDGGNNIYLDNIQFFVIRNVFTVYPNPTNNSAIYLALNLPESENAEIDVIDRMGKVIHTETINNALNQILLLSLPDVRSGIYLVRLRTSTQTHTEKLLIID